MSTSNPKTEQSRSRWSSSQEIHFRVTRVGQPGHWAGRPHLWRPPTDLFETENLYVVRVEIAGMQNEELNVSMEGRTLAIYGQREVEHERAAYHQMEVRVGEFLSLVELPGEADVEQINAEYNDGFLRVTLPKVNR